ncbi:hypothetical protein V2J09_005125 [Rumex salicifolius]
MDYSSNGETLQQWQEEDYYCLEKEPSLEITECMWDGATQEEDFSYILDDTTPIKACGDAPFHLSNSGETSKETDGCRVISSQVKRRRMLQFNNVDLNLTFQSDTSAFLKSKEKIDAIDEALSEASQWEANFQEDSYSSGLECLDQSEDWLADCLNDSDMHDSPTDMNSTDVMIDITEFNDSSSPTVAANNTSQQRTVGTSRNIIFKGRKSYMRTPTKLASSVAYPFTFIKPSGENGDVTLKEINQRIRTPPPSKPKEDDPATYGTSAITGKPVVNKTRIRTEGGKGSITIMRTKGYWLSLKSCTNWLPDANGSSLLEI